MSVNVETLEKLERKIILTIPAERIKFEIDKRLQKLARTARMDGFRPGKVPMDVVKKQYGYGVHQEVLNERVGQAFYEAVNEAGINIAGRPTINELAHEGNTDMQFEAIFEVFPEVKLGDLSALEVEKIDAQIDEAAIDRTIEILRKQRRTFNQRSAEQPAQDGDRVTIDFEGKIDGEPFDGGKAEGFQYLVGEGQMLKEFEDAVRGMKCGESKTFPLAFPADYHGKEVAGKTADFLVTVKKLEAPHLPEVDEAFIKQLGVADGNMESLRADIRKNLERETKGRVKARNKNAVMDALLKDCDFDLPQIRVQEEIEGMTERARADMKQRGMKDADKAELPPALFSTLAERRVRLGLIVSTLVKENELNATAEQVKAHVEELAASYEKPADVVSWYMGDRRRLAEAEAVVTEDNVTNFVLGKAKVTSKTISFEDLMGQGS